ncbi:hypothetical protein C8J57DRAFT_1254398 [Mycena rebaudengoi]|nr:hypothetical protein C8J57DRAFT_1254398 [Mycena rebaudengoi]
MEHETRAVIKRKKEKEHASELAVANVGCDDEVLFSAPNWVGFGWRIEWPTPSGGCISIDMYLTIVRERAPVGAKEDMTPAGIAIHEFKRRSNANRGRYLYVEGGEVVGKNKIKNRREKKQPIGGQGYGGAPCHCEENAAETCTGYWTSNAEARITRAGCSSPQGVHTAALCRRWRRRRVLRPAGGISVAVWRRRQEGDWWRRCCLTGFITAATAFLETILFVGIPVSQHDAPNVLFEQTPVGQTSIDLRSSLDFQEFSILGPLRKLLRCRAILSIFYREVGRTILVAWIAVAPKDISPLFLGSVGIRSAGEEWIAPVYIHAECGRSRPYCGYFDVGATPRFKGNQIELRAIVGLEYLNLNACRGIEKA